jgi:hypothetical protein
LDKKGAEAYHSEVARLLYLAKHTRLDILTAVSYLASRVASPTTRDWQKLMRVLGYLKHTKELKVKFSAECDAPLTACVHETGHSRTGVLLMLGGAAIGGWSAKQKQVVKSSTAAEIIALSDGLSFMSYGHATG